MQTDRHRSSRSRKQAPATPPSARAHYRWAAAVRHLRRVDPHLRAIIDRVGPCRLEPYPHRFGALVRSIISQQISTKAAASIHARLVALGGEPHQPTRLIELGEANLRSVGLSSAKARYVLNLAEAVASGQVPLDDFDDSWDDLDITEALTAVKGIGVWTAEMFLIFALNRPDILPAGDLGVRVGLRDRHGLAELPRPRDCHALAEPWRPYRSIASWYIWKGTDTAFAPAVTPPSGLPRPKTRPAPRRTS
jgi:DNA-3-methyladenine glycosylase II